MTLDNFICSGTTPLVKDKLNMYNNGLANKYLLSFNNCELIPSGPLDFLQSRAVINFKTSSRVADSTNIELLVGFSKYSVNHLNWLGNLLTRLDPTYHHHIITRLTSCLELSTLAWVRTCQTISHEMRNCNLSGLLLGYTRLSVWTLIEA